MSSSVSGAIAVPFMGAYAGTKHALEAVTQAFRRELKIYGIEVCVIEPGFIRTAMFDKTAAQSPDARFSGTDFGPMDVVTAAVRNALSSKKPKTRYPLDPLWWIAHILSDRQCDRLIVKAMGLDKARQA